MKLSRLISALMPLVVALAAGTPAGADPTVYTRLYQESPVRGGPGDLLIVAGDGFASGDSVVYRRLTGCTDTCCQNPLTTAPSSSTAHCGVAPVVSAQAQSLTIRLPDALASDETYALRVFRSGSAVTSEFKINDARPKWLSPARVLVSQPVPGAQDSGRKLQIVGRNLHASPNASTKIRLTPPGSSPITINATDDLGPSLNQYVAQASLPTLDCSSANGCAYTVEVSRDGGSSWVTVPQTLDVRKNPKSSSTYSVSSMTYGGCVANDNNDDSGCVTAAIAAAASAGGGTVVFGSGEWILKPSSSSGILVDAGVNLEGQGVGSTTVRRHSTWDTPSVFILEGNNIVQKIRFVDDRAPGPLANGCKESGSPGHCTVFLTLGDSATGSDVEDIAITNNRFELAQFVPIGDRFTSPANRTFRRLYITDNVIEGWFNGIMLQGSWSPTDQLVPQFEDSIIARNDFYPGTFIEPPYQGPIATGLGAGKRLVFQGNVAHAEVLASPTTIRGWRAAFFWHQSSSTEDLLVAENEGYCTSDVNGEGEFLGFDQNHSTPGFNALVEVTGSTSSTVTVAEDPLFEPGYWIIVAKGKGLGQIRKVTQCCFGAQCGADCADDGPVTIHVDPPWDVVPDTDSWITAVRTYSHVYIVGNEVDLSECEKDNPLEPWGGKILLAGSANSVIEGNAHTEADGIQLHGGNVPPGCYSDTEAPHVPGEAGFVCVQEIDGADPSCTQCETGESLCVDGSTVECRTPEQCPIRVCGVPTMPLHVFSEIRGNTIDGEYNFNTPETHIPGDQDHCRAVCCDPSNPDPTPDPSGKCELDYCLEDEDCAASKSYWGGIGLGYGVGPWSPTPLALYGIDVSHNAIDAADDLRGGAIGVSNNWYDVPEGEAAVHTIAIHNNAISNIKRDNCSAPQYCYNSTYNPGTGALEMSSGSGVTIQLATAHNVVLSDNDYTDVCQDVRDHGTATVNLDEPPDTCGLSGLASSCGSCSETSCSSVDLEEVSCQQNDGTSFNCPCSDTAQTTVHRETCSCTGGGFCPSTKGSVECE